MSAARTCAGDFPVGTKESALPALRLGMTKNAMKRYP
jgi:hypothetical protein